MGVAPPRPQPDPCPAQNTNWITGLTDYMLCALFRFGLVLRVFSCSVSVPFCFTLLVFICRVSLFVFLLSYERLSLLTVLRFVSSALYVFLAVCFTLTE